MVAFCALGLQDVYHNGAGRHQWNLNLVQAARYGNVKPLILWLNRTLNVGKIGSIISVVHVLLMGVTKTAVLLQYLRIFVPVRDTRWYLTWVLIGINIAVAVALALCAGLQCIPREKIWTPWIPGRCLDLRALYMTSAISNTVVDFCTWLLPFCTIWRLKLAWQKKLQVSAVFTIGLL